MPRRSLGLTLALGLALALSAAGSARAGGGRGGGHARPSGSPAVAEHAGKIRGGRAPGRLGVLRARVHAGAMRAAGQRAARVAMAVEPRLTHERVVVEVAAPLGALDVGLTVSQLEKVRTFGGPELVHVVGPDGSTNLELILTRVPLPWGQFLELQGPAFNRGADGRLGFRVVGLGITSDLDERGSIKAASYTAEAKLTDRGVAGLVRALAPAALQGLAHTVAAPVGQILGAVVPGVSLGLAALSVGRAIRVLRDPAATRRHRALAVGHALADAVRVVAPMAGVAANLALVAGNAGYELLRARRALAAAR